MGRAPPFALGAARGCDYTCVGSPLNRSSRLRADPRRPNLPKRGRNQAQHAPSDPKMARAGTKKALEPGLLRLSGDPRHVYSPEEAACLHDVFSFFQLSTESPSLARYGEASLLKLAQPSAGPRERRLWSLVGRWHRPESPRQPSNCAGRVPGRGPGGRPALGASRTGHPGRGQAADKASRTAQRCCDSRVAGPLSTPPRATPALVCGPCLISRKPSIADASGVVRSRHSFHPPGFQSAQLKRRSTPASTSAREGHIG
jgi:hypothetical protein